MPLARHCRAAVQLLAVRANSGGGTAPAGSTGGGAVPAGSGGMGLLRARAAGAGACRLDPPVGRTPCRARSRGAHFVRACRQRLSVGRGTCAAATKTTRSALSPSTTTLTPHPLRPQSCLRHRWRCRRWHHTEAHRGTCVRHLRDRRLMVLHRCVRRTVSDVCHEGAATVAGPPCPAAPVARF